MILPCPFCGCTRIRRVQIKPCPAHPPARQLPPVRQPTLLRVGAVRRNDRTRRRTLEHPQTMNPFLRLLFPRLYWSLVWLGEDVGQPKNNNMPRLSTEEELAIIQAAATAITSQREVIASLREQLGSLPAENEALTAALAAADAADAQGDEALSALQGVLEPAPTPEPTPEPEPEPTPEA